MKKKDNDRSEQNETQNASTQPFTDGVGELTKRKPSTKEGLLDAIADFNKRQGGKRYTLNVRRKGGDS